MKTGFEPLTVSELKLKAPSIFTGHPAARTSPHRYLFIPTSKVVQILETIGWLPVFADEKSVRNEQNQGYQKHVIRFRNFNESMRTRLDVGDSLVEIVLTNSHDGLASFNFMAGLFRLVCGNGLIVANGMLNDLRVIHSSFNAANVIDVCAEIINEVPTMAGSINRMREIELTKPEQVAFATAAKSIRWNDEVDVDVDGLIRPKRMEDDHNDIWHTFNTIQENIIRGGIRTRNARLHRSHSREVKSVDENIRLNKALWILAERMVDIKTGAQLSA
ncbi:MAG: DUF932 domain-containing protein [Spirochaetes bacterium]|nr:DUF932 domain-containing protein [Spirochaetota bacterium]